MLLINDYLDKNKRPILFKEELVNIKNKTKNNKIILQIEEVLDSKIRPAVAKDGGDIKFKSFKDGVVKVELRGLHAQLY